MAEPHPSEGSSSASASAGSSDSIVELNIKTLDSQMYSFQVDKNIPVSVFKENVASKTGVPVEQQRLIFRGKVLKDNHLLSEYQVDNGHTLHLVARQPSQPQSSSGTSSAETTTDAGNRAGQETNTGVPRSRVGQVSHSVLLGSFNVGDQLDNSIPDLSRVIGAVLNSIGVGNQTAFNGSSGTQPATMAPQGNEAEGRQGPTADQIRDINQLLRGQVPSGQSMPQVLQIPLGAAIPFPFINQPIPDSLHTLSEFMNRMELTLSQNASQSAQPLNDTGVQPPVNLPANTRGVPTPEALVAVLRHAERLFSGHAISALSRIAGRLEQEGGSTDPTIRTQIQSESMRVGLVMQHLGALLLELGRTMLTLRMGQSSSESSVNAGPAVYISPSGPNPIMVQPSSLQTGSLFGGPVAPPLNSGVFVPGGVGPTARHVNIHIHTVGSRTTNGEGMHGDHGSGITSADPAQPRVLPVRNIVTAAVPSQPAVVSVTNAVPGGGNLAQQSVSSVPLSTIIAGVGSQIRNYAGNMQSQDLGSSAHQESPGNQDQSVVSGAGNNERGNDITSLLDTIREFPLPGQSSDTSSHMAQGEGQKSCKKEDKENAVRAEEPSSSSMKGIDNQVSSSDNTNSAPSSDQRVDVPLGLGLGGLQPRRRSRVSNSRGVVGSGVTSNMPNNHNQPSRSYGLSAGQLAGAGGTVIPTVPMEGLVAGDQDDTANVMSQVLSSPAMDGLLAGVSRQTGVGSPDVLRNMLGQLTQNPAMMNTVNQIAQQMEGQDLGSMFGGVGGSRSGGIDLSRMFQQMMPIVSQALGGGSAFPQPAPFPQPTPAVEREAQPTNSGTRLSRDEKHSDQSSQIDLQQVVQGLEHENPPEEVLRSVAESVLSSSDYGSGAEGLVNELCAEDGLASEFMEMLLHDLSQRVQNETDSTAES
ncbi:ubiquitin-like domain-containing protein CIP73 isoform X2 [Daucus carota subsp. sativus]|uniref:ubiquitin-like domain-containing protein CIP73 isoform X2 n=1 Tax=Daucus carota subsp. sativus TaxID=79200 RepID=UPI0007EFCA85|nr:PREDICTED: large proline-rich protein BAG6 isoform X2 [Daucus carota subsp. sativus]